MLHFEFRFQFCNLHVCCAKSPHTDVCYILRGSVTRWKCVMVLTGDLGDPYLPLSPYGHAERDSAKMDNCYPSSTLACTAVGSDKSHLVNSSFSPLSSYLSHWNSPAVTCLRVPTKMSHVYVREKWVHLPSLFMHFYRMNTHSRSILSSLPPVHWWFEEMKYFMNNVRWFFFKSIFS